MGPMAKPSSSPTSKDFQRMSPAGRSRQTGHSKGGGAVSAKLAQEDDQASSASNAGHSSAVHATLSLVAPLLAGACNQPTPDGCNTKCCVTNSAEGDFQGLPWAFCEGETL